MKTRAERTFHLGGAGAPAHVSRRSFILKIWNQAPVALLPCRLPADPKAPQQPVDDVGKLELVEDRVELGQSGE